MTYAAYHTADLIIFDGSDTFVYGDPCEPGTGAYMESGWVSPDWTRWAVYENRDDVTPSKYDPTLDWCDCAADDCETGDMETCPKGTGPIMWLAKLINDSLPGGVEVNSNGSLTGWTSTLYGADSEKNGDWSTEATRCLHPDGFTDEEVLQAVAWSTYLFNIR